jgi:hypothetical protein
MVYRDGPAFPSAPEPPGPQRAARFGVVRTRLAASSSLVEPLLIIVIGLAIGLVDLTSSEVSGMLRIPALIAGLILVGQGLNLLEDSRTARVAEQVIEEQRESVAVGAADTASLSTGTPRQVVVAGAAVDDGEPQRTPTRAYLVLGLAIWLGVATLAYPTAPLALILLSLLSAYLLFAKGWRTMQTTSNVD